MAELPILHSKRATYEWVDKLQALHDAYTARIADDPDRAERDRAWLDAALVYHSLRLKGVEVGREEVEAARSGEPAASPEVAGALAAVARVREAAAEKATLTPELLLELNGLVDPDRGGKLREGPPIQVYKGHVAPGPEVLDTLLVNAAEWFEAPSFTADFHAIERAALALIRICDLQPFPSNNELTARIAVSLYTLRDGLPPIVVHSEMEEEYRKAILHAVHMDTQPIVDLLARCLELAYADLGVTA